MGLRADVAAGRHGKAAAGAISHRNAPRQFVRARGHVGHVGVRAVLRAAANSHIAPVVQLVHIVFNTPANTCFAHQVGPQFCGDDFIDPPATFHHHGAVKAAKHALAHRIKTAVAAAHADAGGVG